MTKKGLNTRCLLLFAVLSISWLPAQTCTFTTKVIASNDPFGSCPIGTDTILIRDTLVVDVTYEPIIGGLPFDGKLIVDGGVIFWSSNASLKLGANARILLCEGGHLYPDNTSNSFCNGLKIIYFDIFKAANCNGNNAPYSFADINTARCIDRTGICTADCMALSIDPVMSNLGWSLFPNPVLEILHVLSENSGLMHLRIFDSTGRLIWEKTSLLLFEEPVEIQEVSGLPNGIFYLEILTAEGCPLVTKRFLKMNK